MTFAEREAVVTKWANTGEIAASQKEELKRLYVELFGQPGNCTPCFWNDVQTYFLLQANRKRKMKSSQKYMLAEGHAFLRVGQQIFVNGKGNGETTEGLTDEVALALIRRDKSFKEVIVLNDSYEGDEDEREEEYEQAGEQEPDEDEDEDDEIDSFISQQKNTSVAPAKAEAKTAAPTVPTARKNAKAAKVDTKATSTKQGPGRKPKASEVASTLTTPPVTPDESAAKTQALAQTEEDEENEAGTGATVVK